MSYSKKNLPVLLTILFLLLMIFGCAAPACRTHPEFETRSKTIKTVGMFPPDIKIYQLTAGDVRELMDDWCAKGKENVTKSIVEGFKEKPIQLKSLTLDEESKEEIEDIVALYEAVSVSIYLHTYSPAFLFPEKQKNFDYSIGSVEEVLKKCKADALIFVYGSCEISTGGRQALMATGILLTGVTGVYVGPRAGITTISVALIDKSGSILWYSVKSDKGSWGYDLRNPESAEKLVKSILSDFSRAVK